MIQCWFGDYDTHAEYGCHSDGYQYVLKFHNCNLVKNEWDERITVIHSNDQQYI